MIFCTKIQSKFFFPLVIFFILINSKINSGFQLVDSTNVESKNYINSFYTLLSNMNPNIDTIFYFNKTIQNDSTIKLNITYKDTISHNNINLQKDSLNTYLPKWYSMITNLPQDMISFYKEDITINKIPVYLGIGISTAGLILTDNQTWKASDKFYHRTSFNKTASDIFEYVGDGESQLGLAVAFALYGFAFNDDRAMRTASEVVEAVLASGAVVQVLKHITGRESPFVSTKLGGAWRFFPNQIEYHKHVPAYDAYPSGHLTTSLAAFIVIAENYPEYKWIKPVCYTSEALLAISMVNKGIHWYSDYPLAVFLGYEFGNIIAHHGNFNDAQNNNSKKTKIIMGPYFNYLGNGLSVSLEF